MTVAAASTVVSLEVGCCPDAAQIGGPLLLQLRRGYELCSVMPIPESVDEWRAEHRTARKRADRAARRGYVADVLQRENWEQDIYRINTSADSRQGRPMSDGYTRTLSFTPLPEYECGRHAIRTTGVWTAGGRLVAYLAMYRSGDLALVSQILGHASYLEDEIMFLLFQAALEREIGVCDGFVCYNRWDSGSDGLRFFKTRLGFREETVEWLP